ncbi:MAG: hypothetical protein NZM37_11310 [Sandaracinaceae bacterium]|nr:hypothetical protein [Sandaracinaceae bacterium]MDW8246475.1 hypothetical protein [Sandaracinaceae bacterium]
MKLETSAFHHAHIFGISLSALLEWIFLGAQLAFGAGVLRVLQGCTALSEGPSRPQAVPSNESAFEQASSLPLTLPSGLSCEASRDCPKEQLCIERQCRFEKGSVAGEILLASARTLAQKGEFRAAKEAYAQAKEAFEKEEAPPPPELLCEQAALWLGTASDGLGFENGASFAYDCFRHSLPGSPLRGAVERELARFRSQGLDVSLFDRPSKPERFFTLPPSLPNPDSVAVSVELEGENQPGLGDMRGQLGQASLRNQIANCFLQLWSQKREQEARALFNLRFTVRLRDMGDYDLFEPSLELAKASDSEGSFEACVAQAITQSLTPPRIQRVVSWQLPLRVHARMR